MNPYNHNPFRSQQDAIRNERRQSEADANRQLAETHSLVTQELLALRKIVNG